MYTEFREFIVGTFCFMQYLENNTAYSGGFEGT